MSGEATHFAASRRLLWALRLLALTLIVLHLAAPALSEKVAWGLWPTVYLPANWRWGLATVAAASVLFGNRLSDLKMGGFVVATSVALGHAGQLKSSLRRLLRTSQLVVRTSAFFWMRLTLAVLSALPFYLFRIVHTRWGDAYILVNAIPHPEVRLTYTWQAPLDVFLHAKAWALGHHLFGWTDAMPAYWLLSTLAGVLFVWVLLELVAWLGRDRTERILEFGLVATLGTMQLFFGYIENYTFMTLGVLIYAWWGLRALRRETALIWPAAALALTNAFHPSTLVLAPSLLYLACGQVGSGAEVGAGFMPARRWATPGNFSCLRVRLRRITAHRDALAAFFLPYAVVGLGVLALMTAGGHGVDALLGADFPGGGDRRWFVPLFRTATQWEHYTMFSASHLRDILNEQLLTAPAVLPALILIAILTWHRLPKHDREFRFLLLMTASYLLWAWTWNPDYGGQRDWDLFAPAALPSALLLGYTLPRVLPERAALRMVGWALIAAQTFHLLAWVYQNTRPWSWT